MLNVLYKRDVDKIKVGIGDKLSLIINYATTFFAGYAVAFSVSWRATLVITVVLPVLSIVIGICFKVCSYRQFKATVTCQ